MNNKLIYIIFVCMLAMSCTSRNASDNSIALPKEWKFITGDSAVYSSMEFNDQAWKTLNVDSFWETQGYAGYDGIAWYRTRVDIPSSFRNRNATFKNLRISLGRIDDGDSTYFNGKLIGGKTAWDLFRTYLIPIDLINWDKENVLAIRVNDMGGNGGMYGGPCVINDIKLSDVVWLNTKEKPKEFSSTDKKFHHSIFFNFNVPIEKAEGTITTKVYNALNKEVVFNKSDAVTIGTKADSSYCIDVDIKKPGSYKIEYSFSLKTSPDKIIYNTLFTYNAAPRINEHIEFPLVKQSIPGKAMPFDLEKLSFDGYLNNRLNANLMQRLLNIDETGILECYYNRPGKQTWVGEYTGKYLHAASRVWLLTKNAPLKTQMDRIVDILIGCQNEDGYLGTYLPANYWTEWDVWAHKYNLLGFLSYYSVTGYKPALEASIKMGDLLCKTFGEADGQLNIINSSGHIGMASTSVLEPMTLLYQYTGDKKYLDFCNYIIKAYDYDKGPKIISTLTTLGKVDKTANAKAYEMTSNLTGIVKLYQLTGDAKLLKAAENAWNDVSKYKLYITGTASKGELYQEDFVLPAENSDHMGEGCVTTTWIQFSQALYNLTGEAKYIDEIEKSIYNHLLAAENPQTGCVSYYTALQGKKPYRCTIHGHCCLASIPRGIAAIPELVYTKNGDNGFNINIYNGGKISDKIRTKDGKEVSVDCSIDSKFPKESKVTIKPNPEVKSNFKIALRVPVWCLNFIAVIGNKTLRGVPGQYLNVEHEWDNNSTIVVTFDLNMQVLNGGKSYPGYCAIKIGPQVLAFDQALNPAIKDLDKLTIESPNLLPASQNILPKSWIGSQVFKTKAFYNGKPVEINLVPFADAGQTDGEVRVWIKRK